MNHKSDGRLLDRTLVVVVDSFEQVVDARRPPSCTEGTPSSVSVSFTLVVLANKWGVGAALIERERRPPGPAARR